MKECYIAMILLAPCCVFTWRRFVFAYWYLRQGEIVRKVSVHSSPMTAGKLGVVILAGWLCACSSGNFPSGAAGPAADSTESVAFLNGTYENQPAGGHGALLWHLLQLEETPSDKSEPEDQVQIVVEGESYLLVALISRGKTLPQKRMRVSRLGYYLFIRDSHYSRWVMPLEYHKVIKEVGERGLPHGYLTVLDEQENKNGRNKANVSAYRYKLIGPGPH